MPVAERGTHSHGKLSVISVIMRLLRLAADVFFSLPRELAKLLIAKGLLYEMCTACCQTGPGSGPLSVTHCDWLYGIHTLIGCIDREV